MSPIVIIGRRKASQKIVFTYLPSASGYFPCYFQLIYFFVSTNPYEISHTFIKTNINISDYSLISNTSKSVVGKIVLELYKSWPEVVLSCSSWNEDCYHKLLTDSNKFPSVLIKNTSVVCSENSLGASLMKSYLVLSTFFSTSREWMSKPR